MQPDSLVRGLIENRLLALHPESLASVGEGHDDHGHHDHHHGDHEQDALLHEIPINVQAQTEYGQLLNGIRRLGASEDVGRFIDRDFEYDHARIAAVMALEKDNRAMVNEELTGEQLRALKDLPLLRYSFQPEQADDKQEISFWDVFKHANVHNRVRIRRADPDVLLKQAVAQLALRYQEHLIASKTPWQAGDLKDLETFVRDKVAKQAAFKTLGIIADLHHDAAALIPFKQKVTDKEIAAYYEKHKQDYVQVDSVKARHITLKSQEQADRVYAKLNAGMDFAQAVKTFSIADDKDNPLPGDLGVIRKDSDTLPFLHKLALIQPVGKPSTPYRMLDGNTYEIILVDEKKPQTLPLSDKSVRGDIVTRLAQQKAAVFVEGLQKRLLKETHVVVNQRLYPDLSW